VCRNPLVGAQRARKRQELLDATENELQAIKARVDKGTLLGAAQIGLAVGPALKRFHVRKHFDVQITDMELIYQRKQAEIDEEATLDGFYILRTNHSENDVPPGDVVRAYKNLEQAERAFRSIKGPDLQLRPIHHHLEDRVRAHVFICMLAYYLTWHLKAAWKPLLFTDEHRPTSEDPVAKALRSPEAQAKARTKRTTNGTPAHSYQTLLRELGTQTRNTTRLAGRHDTFEKLTQPTALQARALDLARNAPVVTR
jgi:transposase